MSIPENKIIKTEKLESKNKGFYNIENDSLGTRMKRFARKPMISLEELHKRKKHRVEQSVHLLMKRKIAKTMYGAGSNQDEGGPGF